MDGLEPALGTALGENPRVARATVESRLKRMEQAGVITGYGPDVDVAAAGFGVLAFVTLSIAQGALEAVQADLAAIPAVLEAYAVTGCSGPSTRPGWRPGRRRRSRCPRSSPRGPCRCWHPGRPPPCPAPPPSAES